eukprot:g33060.t1
MLLRMMQIFVPDRAEQNLDELLEGKEVLGRWRDTDGKQLVLYLLIPVEETESIMDRFDSAYSDAEGFHVVLMAIEAVLPRKDPEEEEEKLKEEAEDPDSACEKRHRISREELYSEVIEGLGVTRVFLGMTVLSAVVATAGLLRDDVAVVIGAMVIAPLLGPNVAMALGTTLGDIKLIRRAAVTNVVGVITAFSIAIFAGLMLRVDPTIPAIASRTNFGLGDLLLALAAGCAGTLAFTRGLSGAVIGVMVAVALVPPLVVCGMLLGSGQLNPAIGAGLLTVANVICVNLAGVGTTPQPWIMYAPTLPPYPDRHEKWMHEQFLAAGIAVAGIDVGEAYGSPQSRKQITALYNELTTNRGFAKKTCLLGRSRGGLWVSSWAIEHPDKVAGIAGIYPVFDLRAYPGLRRAARAYGISADKLEARLKSFNPIARAGALAKAKIPVCIIHGDSDKVVPLKSNSAKLLELYQQAGAADAMKLIVVKGQGHNVFPGYFRSQALVDFAVSRAKAGAANSKPALQSFLGETDASRRQRAAATRLGLIEIAGVHLPLHPPGDCNHYGWPIATAIGDTIVVMHRRIPGHKAKGAGRPHDKMSYGIVLRSNDAGKTWSKPYDLRDCMRPADRVRGGIVPLSHRMKFDKGNTSPKGYKIHLHAIGTTRDGAVVAINNHGVFRSEDKGRTWTHFSKALRDDTFPHEIVNLGPRLIDHPEQGLLAFGNWFGEVDSYHKYSDRLVALRSRDGGATWKVEVHPAGFRQYEPAALLHHGKYLFVTRDQTKVRAHKQMTWTPGGKPEIIDTNLKDPRLVDTVDFSFNPVTKRFEIVRSERHRMELWLWSIDPADWKTGRWRRECRLLARKGRFYSTADGFHPAGAVVDAQRGVQHIFIYSGHPNGPAGVFRITRTLDTPRLKHSLNSTPRNSND